MNLSTQYHSGIYSDFKAIEDAGYRTIVHFYEKFEDKIKKLCFEELFELTSAYCNALFEIGEYQKHIHFSNIIIETSILENIVFFKGKNLYEDTLFKKAASHYNLAQFNQCEHILKELLKINPHNELNILFLKKCIRRQYPQTVRNFRATSILLILMASLVIIVELFLVKTFFIKQLIYVEKFRTIVFIFGIIALFGGDIMSRLNTNRKVNKFIKTIKKKHEKPFNAYH